ncbi:MAG: DUF2075 domain-containing protein [Lachnospiraceae bacterium]|nr:DUF2075 domain-containing protein [Lachnospiraceae bacterium]
MFPYLRTIDQFIVDCETVTHKFKKKRNGNFGIVRLSPKEFEKWNKKIEQYPEGYKEIRNCKNKSCCEVEIADNHYCYSKSSSPQTKCSMCTYLNLDPKLGCKHVPEIVAWLINNVLYANVEAGYSDAKGVENCSFSQIHAWCQSVCVYMHDVLKIVNNRNISVGLEFYVDYLGKNERVRADMILGGFGRGHKKKMLVIELKQWSEVFEIHDGTNTKWEWNKYGESDYDDPIIQSLQYAEKMKNAIRGNNKKDQIEIVPCVYMHNLESGNINVIPRYVTIQDDILTDSRNESVKVFLEGSDFSGFIDDFFDEKCSVEVFKEYKKRYKTWNISEIADILKTGTHISRYKDSFHWDQKRVYESLLKSIFDGKRIKNEKTLDIIYGGPGSGKTLLAMLLLRQYKHTGKNKGVYALKIISTTNAFVDKYKKDFIDNNKPIDNELKGILENVGFKPLINQLKIYKDKCDPRLRKNIEEFIKLLSVFKYWADLNEEYDLIVFDEAQAAITSKEGIKKLKLGKHIVILADSLQAIGNENLLGMLDAKTAFRSYDIREHYLWSHFRCHADEGYVTWIEQVLGINNNVRPDIIMPYVKDLGENIYYKNLDFQPKAFFVYKDNAKDTLNFIKQELKDKFNVNKLSDLLYLKLPVGTYKSQDANSINTTNLLEHLENKEKIEVKEVYGLAEEGNQANLDRIRGLEYDRVMVIIGPELFVQNGKLKVKKFIDTKRKKEYSSEDVKKMYRILMTRSLKECYFLFVDEEVKKYFENFGKPEV